MKTEAEAKKCWCPFARVITAEGPGSIFKNTTPPHNRVAFLDRHDFEIEGPFPCIASECMAWRWDMSEYADDTDGETGYCGLAGKP